MSSQKVPPAASPAVSTRSSATNHEHSALHEQPKSAPCSITSSKHQKQCHQPQALPSLSAAKSASSSTTSCKRQKQCHQPQALLAASAAGSAPSSATSTISVPKRSLVPHQLCGLPLTFPAIHPIGLKTHDL
eukprot:1161534-Pelagomonas_calceolata.AAC.6